MIPKFIVMADTAPLIHRLEDVMMSLQSGSLDLHGIVGHVIESVQHLGEAPAELLHLPKSLAYYDLIPSGNVYQSDWLFSEESEEQGDILIPDILTSCAANIGHHLLEQFQQLRLYQEGTLNYEYEGVTSDKSILLRHRPRHE